MKLNNLVGATITKVEVNSENETIEMIVRTVSNGLRVLVMEDLNIIGNSEEITDDE